MNKLEVFLNELKVREEEIDEMEYSEAREALRKEVRRIVVRVNQLWLEQICETKR